MSLDLSPEVETNIRQCATVAGVTVNDFLARTFASEKPPLPTGDIPLERVQKLLAQWQTEDNKPLFPPVPTLPRETPTRALFRVWEEEDACMTEEEKVAEDRLWEEMEPTLGGDKRAFRLVDAPVKVVASISDPQNHRNRSMG